ncbi:MAG: hypothetical protein IPK32_09750 [Verrucomicrobiaceae bacterium]|nr:hypothetical protein [Verrucomicrobiaceae bacterium]
MRHSLVPLACEQRHPACFFAGLRLVGIDGGQWNLLNTVQINAQVPKAAVVVRRQPLPSSP